MTHLADLSNEELLAEVSRLTMRERQATAALIRGLMEVDARRLYLAEGYSSLFTFCTQALHLSEHAALGRIEVARAARRLPMLLRHLEDGSLTVTNARMLAPHMTQTNCEELLANARHRSKREVEEIVARLRPQPDVRSAVRKLPSCRVTPSAVRCPSSENAPAAKAPVAIPHGGTIGEIHQAQASPAHRRYRRDLSLQHSRPSASRFSSPGPERCTRSSGTHRICSGTSCRAATSPWCSIGRCLR